MPVEVKDALTLMISFGALVVALLTLVVTIVVAVTITRNRPPWSRETVYFN